MISILGNFKAAFRKRHLALGKAEPSPRGRSHRQMDLVSEQEGILCPGRAYWTRRLHWGTAIAWAICQVGGDAGRQVAVKALSSLRLSGIRPHRARTRAPLQDETGCWRGGIENYVTCDKYGLQVKAKFSLIGVRIWI